MDIELSVEMEEVLRERSTFHGYKQGEWKWRG